MLRQYGRRFENKALQARGILRSAKAERLSRYSASLFSSYKVRWEGCMENSVVENRGVSDRPLVRLFLFDPRNLKATKLFFWRWHKCAGVEGCQELQFNLLQVPVAR